MRISIKPISINQSWQGKRYKTPLYKNFEKEMLLKLKPFNVPDGYLSVYLKYGFSNRGQDIDSCIKNTLDILQKKYDFNDNRIYHLEVFKDVVKKGKEYIEFNITQTK